jgi:hypothetical protein
MDDNLVRFLTGSPMAKKIKLPAKVVVQRTELSPRDVMNIKQSGVYGPIPKQDEICELCIGGQRIALGRIVRRKGEYYFKVGRIEDGEEVKEANK